jgi:hypothetical protein
MLVLGLMARWQFGRWPFACLNGAAGGRSLSRQGFTMMGPWHGRSILSERKRRVGVTWHGLQGSGCLADQGGHWRRRAGGGFQPLNCRCMYLITSQRGTVQWR